jgi:predicted metal-dependent hydrolase
VEVTVIRSAKRRKTAQARMVDGVLEVRIPARASRAEERRLVEVFRRRYERAGAAERLDLATRARALARRHDLPEPTEIRWVSNQAHRWGSCTPSTGVIRISDRMASFPPWVVDHVIVHELAHLVEPGHGPAFAELASRYPLAERAEGYLLAKADGVDPSLDPLGDDVDGPVGAATEGTGAEPPAFADGRLFS